MEKIYSELAKKRERKKEVSDMKDYYFHFTGEVRPPNKGERYISNDLGDIIIAEIDYLNDRAIYTRHEVEVPEGTVSAGMCFTGQHTFSQCPAAIIQFNKPKVKKWIWCFSSLNDHYICDISARPMTESEVKAKYPNRQWYHKIDETMIEVEE